MLLRFLHPEFLWALLALVLPIIIHLFSFKRYVKVYFSNLRFLKTSNSEYKRKSKLKKWLILLLRLLALACIVIAFSQPYIPNNKEEILNENENLSIYIDNSFSMNAETERGNALEVAKNKAFELLSSFPDDSNIRVYSNNFSPSLIALNKTQAIASIQEIEPSPVATLLSEQLTKIILDQKGKLNRLYVLSDFQKYQSDFKNLTADSTTQVTLLPISVQKANNLLLDSCWFEKPYHQQKQLQELFVKVRNTSAVNYQKVPVKLSLNDSIKSILNFDIEKHSTKTIKFRYTNQASGMYKGKVEINDFPITYDNSLYFSYQINNKRSVLAINQNDSNPYLNKLFLSTKLIQLKNINTSNIFHENLSDYQLIILNEPENITNALQQNLLSYTKDGGNLLLVPGKQIENSILDFLSELSASVFSTIDSSKQTLSSIEVNADIYKDVFKEIENDVKFPDIYRFYQLKKTANSLSEALWKTRGGQNILSKINYGKGQFFQLSVNLKPEWTNLMTHPLFVPTFVNMTNSTKGIKRLYFIIGSNLPVSINSPNVTDNTQAFHLKNGKLQSDLIPRQKKTLENGILLYPGYELNLAGTYNIVQNDSIFSSCSFNYSRNESDPEYFSTEEIETEIRKQELNFSVISFFKMKLNQLYNEQRNGKQYWKVFIIFCVLFFVCEQVVQKQLKKES